MAPLSRHPAAAPGTAAVSIQDASFAWQPGALSCPGSPAGLTGTCIPTSRCTAGAHICCLRGELYLGL